MAALASLRESLEQSAKAERASALPQIALHAGYNHLDNQILDRENVSSVGVGIQWRLFDSGQVSARVAALRSRARAVGEQRQDLESRIRLEVEAASLNRDEAQSRVAASHSAVEQAEENLRAARELYGSGLGTNAQVLDSEALRTTALTNRDDAEFDLVLANYRLQRAIGEL